MAYENYTKNVDNFIITGFDHLQNQKFLGVLILITYMLILLGNTMNLCIILTARHLHKPMYILICNLAVVDIMYSSTCATTMISVLLAEIKTVSLYSCITRVLLYHVDDFEECMALTLMALDRLMAIMYPLRYHSIVTNFRVFLLIVVTWVAAFLVRGLVIAEAVPLPYCQPIIKYVYCDYAALIRAACVNPEPYFFVPVILSLFPLCGLFPFILCTYAVLAYIVSKLSNNSSKKQLINTCLNHIIVLFCFFVPKIVSSVLTRIGVVLTLTERNAILIVGSLVPPLINPAVYSMRTKEIRRRIAHVFLNKKVEQSH